MLFDALFVGSFYLAAIYVVITYNYGDRLCEEVERVTIEVIREHKDKDLETQEVLAKKAVKESEEYQRIPNKLLFIFNDGFIAIEINKLLDNIRTQK